MGIFNTFQTEQQVALSFLDQELHTQWPVKGTTYIIIYIIYIIIYIIYVLLTKTTAAQNEVALSDYRVRGLYFLFSGSLFLSLYLFQEPL